MRSLLSLFLNIINKLSWNIYLTKIVFRNGGKIKYINPTNSLFYSFENLNDRKNHQINLFKFSENQIIKKFKLGF